MDRTQNNNSGTAKPFTTTITGSTLNITPNTPLLKEPITR